MWPWGAQTNVAPRKYVRKRSALSRNTTGRSSHSRPVKLASPVGGHRAALKRGEGSAAPRAWYIDVDEAAKALELASLKAENYREKIDLRVRRVDVCDRFSERC